MVFVEVVITVVSVEIPLTPTILALIIIGGVAGKMVEVINTVL
jgi:hypothetical protein